MARLLLFVLIGAAAWYGWRVFRRQQARVARHLKEGELSKKKTVELERDPETGVYRPSNKRD